MITEREWRWVERAHSMLTDDAHLEQTQNARGSLPLPELDGPDLRWPGYLGLRYEDGPRVLAVANVHRGFRSKRFLPSSRKYTVAHGAAVTDAVTATRELKKARWPVSDAEAERYLRGVGRMYELGLSGGWRVGDVFRKAFVAAGLRGTPAGVEYLAFANTSCAQVPEDAKLPDAAAVKKKLNECCAKRHPMAGGRAVTDVIALLRPQVVLCCAKDSWEVLLAEGVPEQVLTIPFHQRMGDRRLLDDVRYLDLFLPKGTHVEDWSCQVREHLGASEPLG